MRWQNIPNYTSHERKHIGFLARQCGHISWTDLPDMIIIHRNFETKISYIYKIQINAAGGYRLPPEMCTQ